MSSERPIECRGIDHVVLRVRDIERSLRFYTEVLGLSLERVIDALPVYQLRCGQNLIDLCILEDGKELAGPGESGIDHLCLRVRGEVDALHAWLRSNEVEILGGPVEVYGASGFGTSIYVRDPDGHTLELKAEYSQYAVHTTASREEARHARPKPGS